MTGGHLARAAELLGIHRNTLRRKLQEYGLGEMPADGAQHGTIADREAMLVVAAETPRGAEWSGAKQALTHKLPALAPMDCAPALAIALTA
jgi:hypothetical protein